MRKVYCNYFYDLVSHALILIRPECMFNTVKSIRASTSYCWPDYIIRNLFVCHQVAQHVGESNTAAAKQKSQLSKLAKSLLHSKNIVTPISVIKRNARCWQDHLKKQLILFFLEKGIWWEQRDDIIELYDSPSALGERPEHGKTTGFLVGSRDEIGDAEVEDIP